MTANDKVQPDEASVAASDSPVTAASAGPAQGRSVLTPLLLVVLLGAAGGGGYLLWQQQQTVSLVDSSLRQALAREQGLRTDINALQQQVAASDRRENALTATLGSLQAQLDTQAQRVKSLVATDRQDWQLAEAEYLLRLANQRLLIERNPAAALPLLESADRIVGAFEDTDLLTVRAALARDLMALRLTPLVDRAGIYVQLSALEEQIAGLPLANADALPTAPASAADAETAVGWRQVISHSFARLLDKIAAQFSVQHHAEPLEPLLAPDQQLILRQNLRVLLAQAQLAVLREDSLVFHNSLHQVATLLSRYFTFNQTQAQPLVVQVQNLAAINITQNLPDIRPSLDSLAAFNERRHKSLASDKQNRPQLEAGRPAAEVQP